MMWSTFCFTATVTQINLARSDYDNTGLMVDTTNHQIVLKRSGVYNLKGTVVWDSPTAAAGNRLLSIVFLT